MFLSDTRTNAGVDNVSTYRKLHVLRPRRTGCFVLESAGNLATTQEVLDRIAADLDADDAREPRHGRATSSRRRCTSGGSAARWRPRHREALPAAPTARRRSSSAARSATRAPDILLVYPEGNYIRASDDRPFLQIGESKYGKFMLELAVAPHVDLVTATKIALGSMMSTARANPRSARPYDAGVYRTGDLRARRVPLHRGVGRRSRRSSASSETCGSRRSSTPSAASRASLRPSSAPRTRLGRAESAPPARGRAGGLLPP